MVFDADRAEAQAQAGEAVILVRRETSPEDFHGMVAARAVLTARGGMTSHAAVVARGLAGVHEAAHGEVVVVPGLEAVDETVLAERAQAAARPAGGPETEPERAGLEQHDIRGMFGEQQERRRGLDFEQRDRRAGVDALDIFERRQQFVVADQRAGQAYRLVQADQMR